MSNNQNQGASVEADLLPCPMCSGTDVQFASPGGEDEPSYDFVICNGCGVSVQRADCDSGTDPKAVWNRRTPAPAGAGEMPPPDVIAYTCIGDNDAYSPAKVKQIVAAAIAADRAQLARQAQGEIAGYLDIVSRTFYPSKISVDKYADRPERVKALYLAAPASAQPDRGAAPELPPLPAQPDELRARWKCEDCDGRGHDGEPFGGDYFQPPEPGQCTTCEGSGWVETAALLPEQVTEYAQAAYALGRAAPHSQPVRGVPEGFVQVPVEPTDAMMSAAEACSDDWPRTTWVKAWNAMLAAAPSPAAQPSRRVRAVMPADAPLVIAHQALSQPVAPAQGAQVGGQWISVEDRMPEGRYCLAVYETPRGQQRIIRAMYVRQYEVEATGDECDSEYNEADDRDYLKAGWLECIDNWGEYSSVYVTEGKVTHWMPLPATPGKQPHSTATEGADQKGTVA